jgi:hypothetical protein
VSVIFDYAWQRCQARVNFSEHFFHRKLKEKSGQNLDKNFSFEFAPRLDVPGFEYSSQVIL